MLDPDFRRLYSECFAAPPDHDLDGAVGTTYSLDLDSLLFAMFCLSTSGVEDPEGAMSNPVALLEAIHRTSERVTLFAHVGEMNAPARPRSLYALLERCVMPAQGRGGAIFHPKLWALRYRSRADGSALVRVVVLSRNLTSSRAWDQLVCLEGAPEATVLEENRELVELMRALPSFVVGEPLPEARLVELEGLARDVARTRFAAPVPFSGVARFMALGVRPGRRFELPGGDRLFAMAPFVSTDALKVLRAQAKRAQLVARAEELAKCTAAAVGEWEVSVLHEGASLNADSAEGALGSDTADAAPEGLHAKVYAVESGQQVTWWLGSGNLTDPVRDGTSVELMVSLTGKVSSVGIDAFLDAGFGSLLEKYQHQAAPTDAAEGSRACVERTKRQLCAAPLALRCRPDGALWTLALDGALPDPVEGVEATCRIVTLPPHRAIRLFGDASACEFAGLSPEGLSAFLAIRLVAGTGEARFEHEFTLKLSITGLPQDRDARVARAIVKDRAAFMAYLRCLFEELAPLVGGEAEERHAESEGAAALGASLTTGLLEPMLRTVHRDPERLRGLRALLESCESGADAAVIPAEFRAVWAAVEPFLPSCARAAE